MVVPGALRVLAKAGLYYGISRVLTEGGAARTQLRKMAVGGGLLLAAMVVAYPAILALLLALFFYFAGADGYIRPAVITGVVALLVSALLGWEGWRRVKFPTRR